MASAVAGGPSAAFVSSMASIFACTAEMSFARLAEATSSGVTGVGLFTARSRRRAQSPALPGDTHLSFSLLALGVPDFAPVCPRQLAVQSACAARQSFGTAYGMSLLSGGSWPMLHAINT